MAITVSASWSKRRIELERMALRRTLSVHQVACSQCAAAGGNVIRLCDTGYDLVRSIQRLDRAHDQAKGIAPAPPAQGALW